MPFMQRKSIGHSRKKHGEQGASDFRIFELLEKTGPVNSGDVLPKIATTGVFKAAATCIGPVSFVKSTRQIFKSAINSRSEVFPAKFRILNFEF